MLNKLRRILRDWINKEDDLVIGGDKPTGDEPEMEFEPDETDYSAQAYWAMSVYDSLTSMDTATMSQSEAARVRRMKKYAIKTCEASLKTAYDTIFSIDDIDKEEK